MSIYKSNTHGHSVGWSLWHFQWCTKYRYKVFTKQKLKNICLIAILEAAKRSRIKILEMEVDRDHVHVVASLPMTMAPTQALQYLKGFSARLIFAQLPKLKSSYPKGHLWSPGKFAASIGHITLEKAKNYIEEHHAKALLPTQESSLRSEAEELPEGQPFRARRMSITNKYNGRSCKKS